VPPRWKVSCATNGFAGDAGISVRRPGRFAMIATAAGDTSPTASMIKVPIALRGAARPLADGRVLAVIAKNQADTSWGDGIAGCAPPPAKILRLSSGNGT
jgi:hypothetical protein